jgi:NAD(P)-dependent dehydrogenase (short-subunit alcohol dehydrogenase family)
MAEQSLAGRVALITGAAKRIGRSIALEFGRRGARVVVNYRTSREEAQQVGAEIVGAGGQAAVFQADVSKREEVERLIAQTQERFGGLDVLVNNAGMIEHISFDKITDEKWNRVLATNLTSQFLCAQVAAPLLRKSKPGRIINLASLGGILAWPGYIHYCVSKAGVIQLTRCLARALAPEIIVNAIAPGTISYPGDAPQLEADYIKIAPMRRTGTGDDIAETAVFLAETEFITGQIVAVDGGRVLAT